MKNFICGKLIYQYRWTNPKNIPNVQPSELEWKNIENENGMQNIEQACSMLLSYNYKGIPFYEIRSLYFIFNLKDLYV
jgi:hypothetical protein